MYWYSRVTLNNAKKNNTGEYKKLRNKVVKMVKADKTNNAAKMLDKNPHDFWKIFNKIVHGNNEKAFGDHSSELVVAELKC